MRKNKISVFKKSKSFSPTFQGDICAEDYSKWCEKNCEFDYKIHTAYHVDFEDEREALAFIIHFWGVREIYVN